jgi:hypothetical protein
MKRKKRRKNNAETQSRRGRRGKHTTGGTESGKRKIENGKSEIVVSGQRDTAKRLRQELEAEIPSSRPPTRFALGGQTLLKMTSERDSSLCWE